MFNPVERFEAYFEPHGDGYVVWPSPRHGGKSVSVAEHAAMREAIARHVGTGWGYRPLWMAMVAIVLLSPVGVVLDWPRWTGSLLNGAVISALLGYDYYWVTRPIWKMRKREDVLPPRGYRPALLANAQALSWPLLAIVLFTGLIGLWYAYERAWATNLAIVAALLSCTMLVLSAILGVAKARGKAK